MLPRSVTGYTAERVASVNTPISRSQFVFKLASRKIKRLVLSFNARVQGSFSG
ncbi:hypothetical protein BT69DRAFT_1285863 [Atractiella rhizophila]|nr:hypothetical protein BT69DRAFT_1285863 [Atractiella rhizophila]